jgi:hypothetical protein
MLIRIRIRNTQPLTGTAATEEKLVIQIPIATCRCRGSGAC